jgi:EF hand
MRAALAAVLSLLPLSALAEDLSPGAAPDAAMALPAGSNDIIRLARAGSRALALRRLTDIDANGDGAISASELVFAGDAATDLMRGRLQVYFAQADGNGDGAVSGAELSAYGQVVALQAAIGAGATGDIDGGEV